MSQSAAAEDASLAWAELMITGSCAGAFTFLLYDMLLTARDEIKYIWPMHTSPFKLLYMFVRYFGFATQLCHFIGRVMISSSSPSQLACGAWYVFDVLTVEFISICVEGILGLRVWVLCNRDARVFNILVSLAIMELVIMVVLTFVTAFRMDFVGHCIQVATPTTMIYFNVVAIFAHLVVLLFTAYNGLARWQRTIGHDPMLGLLVSDGAKTFAGYFVVMITTVLLYVCVDRKLTSLGIYWVVSIMSISGARIVINMQALVTSEREKIQYTEDSVELTTVSVVPAIPIHLLDVISHCDSATETID